MDAEPDGFFVAECFWPGVGESDLQALEERIGISLADGVRYVGSLLMRADEVVLCQFEGRAEAVRETAERARIPYERILETARSPWRNEKGET
jgi:hypothetical protein